MAKTEKPLLSLGAHGTLRDALTFQKRSGVDFVRQKPTPTDPKSLAQIYHRWDYQDYAYQWHSISLADWADWRAIGTRAGITPFNAFMSDKLKTLPDLAMRLRLDETAGALAYDSSKNSNTGTVFGSLVVPGWIDNARWSDGLDDRITVPHHTSLNLTEWTIELIIQRDRLATSEFLLIKDNTGGSVNANFGLYIIGNNKLRGIIGIPPGPLRYVDSDITLAAGTKYHLAFTFKKPNARLFINGQPHGVAVLNFDPVPNTSPLYISRWLVWFPFRGTKDNVILYNRALDSYEIERHSERRYPQ